MSNLKNLEIFVADEVEFRDDRGVVLEGVVQVARVGGAGRRLVGVFERGAILTGINVPTVIGL